MADPVLISVSLQDASGKRKSYLYFGADDLDVAGAQSAFTASAPKLDAVSDAKIIAAHVTLPLTLPGGLKGAAVAGNRVREGALLGYSASGTAKRFGTYVPAWANAGFAVGTDDVANTGVYATFITDLQVNYSDAQARALVAFLSGVRAFRK